MVTTIYLIAAKMMVQFVGDPASLLDNSLKIHNGKNMIGIPKYQERGFVVGSSHLLIIIRGAAAFQFGFEFIWLFGGITRITLNHKMP